MSLPLIEQLKETFGNLANFTPEKLQALIQETLKTFQLIQAKIKSQDPKEREEGMLIAIELKKALEIQAAEISKSVEMAPAQLNEYVENPENFSKEEWDVLGLAKSELDVFKKQIGAPQEKAPRAQKMKKSKKTWLVG